MTLYTETQMSALLFLVSSANIILGFVMAKAFKVQTYKMAFAKAFQVIFAFLILQLIVSGFQGRVVSMLVYGAIFSAIIIFYYSKKHFIKWNGTRIEKKIDKKEAKVTEKLRKKAEKAKSRGK